MATSAFATSVAAQEEDLLRVYGTERTISLATGYQQPLAQAPAVATVITRAEIEAMAATNIEEVLARATGIHVSRNRVHDSVFVIRSIYSELNPHVLFMVNGVPIGDAVQGGRPIGWTMSVKNVSRIEIVRGPGSALYGADAFAGTINVVTKSAEETDGLVLGVLGGHFDTIGGWAMGGRSGDGSDIAWYVEARSTDGQDSAVAFDAQSGIDLVLGTRASLAPGPINTGRDDIEARVDVGIGDHWRWRAGYQSFMDVETGTGGRFALDARGARDVALFTTDAEYTHTLNDDWSMSARLSYLHQDFESLFQLFPPGAFGVFPEGVLNSFDFVLTEGRGAMEWLYSGRERHTVLLGAGLNYQEADEIKERRNFFRTPVGLAPAPGFLDVTDLGVPPAAFPEDRTDVYAFVQDEWRFAPDWTLTAGLRLDEYSDFGSTANPRVSLVWNVTSELTAKMLYGRAFRPPTFLEKTNGTGQIAQGNPNLDPETIDTVELAVIKDWGATVTARVNAYYYDTDDLIGIAPDPVLGVPTFFNTGGTEGHGLEAELDYRATDDITMRLSYALQRAEENTTDEDVGLAPQDQAYAEVDWRIVPTWYLNVGVKWVGDRERAPDDPTPGIDAYVWGDLTLRYLGRAGLEGSLSVRNLFDDDAFEPASDPPALPGGIPLAERHAMLQLMYRF